MPSLAERSIIPYYLVSSHSQTRRPTVQSSMAGGGQGSNPLSSTDEKCQVRATVRIVAARRGGSVSEGELSRAESDVLDFVSGDQHSRPHGPRWSRRPDWFMLSLRVKQQIRRTRPGSPDLPWIRCQLVK